MLNFIAGLVILTKYFDDANECNIGAEYDVVYVFQTDKDVTENDKITLNELGFYPSDSGGWCYGL